MKIYCIGLSGFIGSRIETLLKEKYNFVNVSKRTGVDITDKSTLSFLEKTTDIQIVFNLAAKTDVDGCEQDKSLGMQGEAWKVNVEGVKNIVNACLKTKKKIIYVSTDFVFDGTKDTYIENDIPNPINWYGETKYQGEKIIQASGLPYIIMRIAYPYCLVNNGKKDFVSAIKSRLQEHKPVQAVIDHILTPTYVDDIAFALDGLISQNAEGIYHVVGNQSLSPYEIANFIADAFNYDRNLITKTSREEFFKGRAKRPFKLALNNDKIHKLGIQMKSFEEGLQILSKQNDML